MSLYEAVPSRPVGSASWHVMCACGCRKALADWVQAAVLDTGNQAVTSLDWALGRSESDTFWSCLIYAYDNWAAFVRPSLGVKCRPVELIAAASSAGVHIWSLKGRAHELQVSYIVDFST